MEYVQLLFSRRYPIRVGDRECVFVSCGVFFVLKNILLMILNRGLLLLYRVIYFVCFRGDLVGQPMKLFLCALPKYFVVLLCVSYKQVGIEENSEKLPEHGRGGAVARENGGGEELGVCVHGGTVATQRGR